MTMTSGERKRLGLVGEYTACIYFCNKTRTPVPCVNIRLCDSTCENSNVIMVLGVLD